MFNRSGFIALILMMSVSPTPAFADDWSPIIQRQLDALKDEPSVQKVTAEKMRQQRPRWRSGAAARCVSRS